MLSGADTARRHPAPQTPFGLRAYDWHNFNFGWGTNIHGSIACSVSLLHKLDAVADLIFTVVLIVIIAMGFRHKRARRTDFVLAAARDAAGGRSSKGKLTGSR